MSYTTKSIKKTHIVMIDDWLTGWPYTWHSVIMNIINQTTAIYIIIYIYTTIASNELIHKQNMNIGA